MLVGPGAGSTRQPIEAYALDDGDAAHDIAGWLARTAAPDDSGGSTGKPTRKRVTARAFRIRCGDVCGIDVRLRPTDDALLAVDVAVDLVHMGPLDKPFRTYWMLVQFGGANVVTFRFTPGEATVIR